LIFKNKNKGINGMYITKDLFGYQIVSHNDNRSKISDTITQQHARDYKTDSKFRAKRQVIEYSMNNIFNWFVTITFDKNKIDRYDSKLLETKIRKWLNNIPLLYDSEIARYIMVPEYHKDKAIHFHLLINMNNDRLKYLFNHKNWNKAVYRDNYLFKKFGRNEWVKIDAYTEPIGLYLSKYITKLPDKMNTQYYFASQGLNESEKIEIELDLHKIDILPSAVTTFATVWRLTNEQYKKLIGDQK
jgi:hypothetical protein